MANKVKKEDIAKAIKNLKRGPPSSGGKKNKLSSDCGSIFYKGDKK